MFEQQFALSAGHLKQLLAVRASKDTDFIRGFEEESHSKDYESISITIPPPLLEIL